MSVSINDMIKRIQATNVEQVAESAVSETKDLIGILNLNQFGEGQYSDGSYLPDYSKMSVEVFGKPPGPIKLFETGDYWRALKVDVANGLYKISNTDPKALILETRYQKKGKKLYGMTQENKIEYVKELQPVFVKQMKLKLKV